MVDEENKHEMAGEKITDVTHVTQWRVPKAKCPRRYGATPYKLFKKAKLILTLSTIFGWERDKLRINYRVLQNTLPFRFQKFLCVTVWLWLSVTQCHANLQPCLLLFPLSCESVLLPGSMNSTCLSVSSHSLLTDARKLSQMCLKPTGTKYNQPINPFICPCGHKRVLDCNDLNYIESILLAELALFWMKSKTSFILCGITKSQSQHSLALSIASRSLTKLLPGRQWNGTSIFVLHGRLPWHNMMLVSLFSLTKLEWMITQIFGQMVGLCLGECVCARQLFCEGRNNPFFQHLVKMVFWHWTSLRGLWTMIVLLVFFAIILYILFFILYSVVHPLILTHQAPHLNPFPMEWSVVVIDNCSIHHNDDIQQIIEVKCGMVS